MISLSVPPLPLSLSVTGDSEKGSLERRLAELQGDAEARGAELEEVQGAVLELQRERDLLRQKREDLEEELGLQRSQTQRG